MLREKGSRVHCRLAPVALRLGRQPLVRTPHEFPNSHTPARSPPAPIRLPSSGGRPVLPPGTQSVRPVRGHASSIPGAVQNSFLRRGIEPLASPSIRPCECWSTLAASVFSTEVSYCLSFSFAESCACNLFNRMPPRSRRRSFLARWMAENPIGAGSRYRRTLGLRALRSSNTLPLPVPLSLPVETLR